MLNNLNLIKTIFWFLLSIMRIMPNDLIYAQDVDEEGEMFWGDDEEFEDDEEEYEDDEEYEEEPMSEGHAWAEYDELCRTRGSAGRGS